MIKAQPKLLVEEGRLCRGAMRRELMPTSELMTQLRLHGIEDISQVERAFLEPNGMISVVRRGGDEVDEPGRPEML